MAQIERSVLFKKAPLQKVIRCVSSQPMEQNAIEHAEVVIPTGDE
jgi:hypothetical protein